MTILCMEYKIGCNPMYPLFDPQPVPAQVTRCFGHTSVYLCISLLQHLTVPQDFYSFSVSLWNDLADLVFDGVGLVGFKRRDLKPCRTWSCGIKVRRTFIPFYVLLWNALAAPVFNGVGLATFRAGPTFFCNLPKLLAQFISSAGFPFFSSFL